MSTKYCIAFNAVCYLNDDIVVEGILHEKGLNKMDMFPFNVFESDDVDELLDRVLEEMEERFFRNREEIKKYFKELKNTKKPSCEDDCSCKFNNDNFTNYL